jgi:hypothetical protein
MRLPQLSDGESPAFLCTYDNFFRCIYSINPIFTDPGKSSGACFILDAISLLQVAESLDAAKAVRTVIEAHLIRLGQPLWYHIERNSEVWADIAVRLESPIIFREAMLHIIGKFDTVSRGELKGVNKVLLSTQENGRVVLELAAKKAKELKEKKLQVERTLLEWFPQKMIHGDTDAQFPGHQLYATDVYLWIGLTIVRQFLSSCMQGNMHHRNPDGGVKFYRSIGTGKEAYLGDEALERFHETFPMTSKSKQQLQRAVEFIKDKIKSVVNDLLVDRTQTSSTAENCEPRIPYLTCSEILDADLPWIERRTIEVQDKVAEKDDRCNV